MNFVVAPPNHRNDGVPEGDEIDQTLRAFFKAQVPDPWPSFEAPPSKSVLPFAPQRSSSLRRRLALAASVAVLAAGGWLLSGKFVDRTPVAEPEILIRDGSATPDPDGILRSKPFLPVNPDGSVDSIKFVVPPPPGKE